MERLDRRDRVGDPGGDRGIDGLRLVAGPGLGDRRVLRSRARARIRRHGRARRDLRPQPLGPDVADVPRRRLDGAPGPAPGPWPRVSGGRSTSRTFAPSGSTTRGVPGIRAVGCPERTTARSEVTRASCDGPSMAIADCSIQQNEPGGGSIAIHPGRSTSRARTRTRSPRARRRARTRRRRARRRPRAPRRSPRPRPRRGGRRSPRPARSGPAKAPRVANRSRTTTDPPETRPARKRSPPRLGSPPAPRTHADRAGTESLPVDSRERPGRQAEAKRGV